MTSTYHASDDDAFDVNEPIEVGDLSDQSSGQDTIDPARNVPFLIRKAEIRTQLENNRESESEDNKWKVKRLKLQVAVDATGTDGEGRYANKVFFPELILTMNTRDFPDQYQSEWWQKKARGPFKEFLLALDYDIKQPPVVNDGFLSDIIGMGFLADIRRVPVTQKNPETQKYEKTGAFENTVENFKKLPE